MNNSRAGTQQSRDYDEAPQDNAQPRQELYELMKLCDVSAKSRMC